MKASTRPHASADASANSSCFRSKKLCGAPSYIDDLVLDAGVRERLRRRRDLLGGDALRRRRPSAPRIGASISRGPLGRPGLRRPRPPGPAVEADRAGEPVTARRGQPRVAAAEAEADREDRLAAGLAQPRDAGGDVGLDARRRRLLRRAAMYSNSSSRFADAGGAAEVVDRDRGDDPRSAKRSASSS